jgi:hypothetical protein
MLFVIPLDTTLLAGADANFACLWFVYTVKSWGGATNPSASAGLRVDSSRIQTEDKKEFQGVTPLNKDHGT